MRKTKILIFVFLLTTLVPTCSLAQSIDKLPAKESSKQWEVIINKGDHEDSKLNQSDNPKLYNIYSMDIKNIGNENAKLVRVEAYRDQPISTKEYELFTADFEGNETSQPSFHHTNFPLYSKATKLNVIITWKEKSNSSHQRKYREQFVFEQ